MIIAISSTAPSLAATIDSHFGRCLYFVLIETDDMKYEIIENNNGAATGGAGIKTAQLIAQKGAKAVLTGNCGPNAHETLSAAGIAVYIGCSGSISEAVSQFTSGKLQAATSPNVESHNGKSV